MTLLTGTAAVQRGIRCELVAIRNSISGALKMPGALDSPEAMTLAFVQKMASQAIEAIDNQEAQS